MLRNPSLNVVGRSPTFAYWRRSGTKPAQFLYRRIIQFVNEFCRVIQSVSMNTCKCEQID